MFNRKLPMAAMSCSLLFLIIFISSCSKDTDLLAEYVSLPGDTELASRVVDDTYTITSDISIVLNVLDNDNFTEQSQVSIVATSNPTFGSVVINEDNTLTYTPNTDTESETTEEDSFTYNTEETNEAGETTTDEGTVTVNTEKTADFKYENFQFAYDDANSWEHNAVIRIESEQGGLFTYDSNSTLQQDEGTIFKVPNRNGNLLRSWNHDGTVYAEWYGIISNNENSKNSTNFQKMVNAHLTGIVNKCIFNGTYYFKETLNLNNADGLEISGLSIEKPSSFIINNSDHLLRTRESAHNIIIRNIDFLNLNENINHTPGASLISFAFGQFTNHLVSRCSFSSPGQTNGVKYTIFEDGQFAENIEITESKFINLGQMGIEFVNHNDAQPDFRYRRVKISNNHIENVGLKNYGMGISLSGKGKNVIIENNYFNNCPVTAIELVGTEDTTINANAFEGNLSPLHIVEGSGQTNKNIKFNNNQTIGSVTLGMVWINAVGIQFSNNTIKTDKGNYSWGVSNVSFDTDIFETNDNYVWSFRSGSMRAATDISFSKSILSQNSLTGTCLEIQSGNYEKASGIALNCSELHLTTSNKFYTGYDLDVHSTKLFSNNTWLNQTDVDLSSCN